MFYIFLTLHFFFSFCVFASNSNNDSFIVLFCKKEKFSCIRFSEIKTLVKAVIWIQNNYFNDTFMLVFCHFEAWQPSYTFITKLHDTITQLMHNFPAIFFNISHFLFHRRKKPIQVLEQHHLFLTGLISALLSRPEL